MALTAKKMQPYFHVGEGNEKLWEAHYLCLSQYIEKMLQLSLINDITINEYLTAFKVTGNYNNMP